MKLCDVHCVAICDFCVNYSFNADDDLAYVGKGFCNHLKLQKEPEDSCEDFECYTLYKKDVADKDIELIREAIKDGLSGALTPTAALCAIHTIVNPAEPDADDIKWAKGECRYCELDYKLQYWDGYGWFHFNSDGGPDLPCTNPEVLKRKRDELI